MTIFIYRALLTVINRKTFHADAHVAQVPSFTEISILSRTLLAGLFNLRTRKVFVTESSLGASESRSAPGYHGVNSGHGGRAVEACVLRLYRDAALALALHPAVALRVTFAVVFRIVLDNALLVDARDDPCPAGLLVAIGVHGAGRTLCTENARPLMADVGVGAYLRAIYLPGVPHVVAIAFVVDLCAGCCCLLLVVVVVVASICEEGVYVIGPERNPQKQ